MTMADQYDVVIIGAGPSAAGVVQGLQEANSTATVGIYGAASTPPLYRPDLSKTLWLEEGKQVSDSYLLPDDANVDLHLGVEVTGIDPTNHQVTLEGGTQVGYGSLVIATGSRPVTLGANLGPRVLPYREAGDYQALRPLVKPGAHAVIVGGGYIGAELTSAMIENEVEVTQVMPEEYVQQQMFPAELAARITQGFRERGVRIVNGLFDSAAATDSQASVTLLDGREISGDVVILGVGVRPRVGLAEDAGLEVDDGITVDTRLRTSAPDVYAVGDVASFVDPLLGRRRVEHIDNAESMGAAAGRVLAGQDVTYDHTPFFWSALFADGYEAIGELDSSRATLVDWSKDGGAAVVCCVGKDERAGQVRGVLLWNTWDSIPIAQALIERTASQPVASIEDLRGEI